MKPYVRGKTVFLREVAPDDAEFIVTLRTDPEKSRHLSATSSDVVKQEAFISSYFESRTDFYFVICDWSWRRLGTVRIYDIREDSFCWGSWILCKDAPKNAAIESALLVYDFGFFSLHYPKAHFDVRKENERVVDFHKRFGAAIIGEDELNYYFDYDIDRYMEVRGKYRRFLP
jgi:RimJ/RimL family protein N-acetyltransferase